MTAVVFLLYDGIEKEIVKGIYLVLEINRRIMTYLYSKTIFCALMDSYKWMTNISTPYVYQIENAENIKKNLKAEEGAATGQTNMNLHREAQRRDEHE